jgi:hypothetical protein
MARRLGIAGIGKDRWEAGHDLTRKEIVHEGGTPAPAEMSEAIPTVMKMLFRGLLD